jgi:hypothetical protein
MTTKQQALDNSLNEPLQKYVLINKIVTIHTKKPIKEQSPEPSQGRQKGGGQRKAKRLTA